MLPTRVYESVPVERSLTATGLDASRLRERTRLTGSRIPDDEFEDRLVSACNLIEQQTGLRIFAGAYEAEFDIGKLWRNSAYLTAELEVPGVNATITSLKIGERVIEPRKTVTNWNIGSGSSAGNNGAAAALPPFNGWPVFDWTQEINERLDPVATFTAGGSVPQQVIAAIASQARMEHIPSPQEASLLEYYLSKIRMR